MPKQIVLPTDEEIKKGVNGEVHQEELPDSHGYKDDDYASDDTEQRKVDMTKRLNSTLQRAYKASK